MWRQQISSKWQKNIIYKSEAEKKKTHVKQVVNIINVITMFIVVIIIIIFLLCTAPPRKHGYMDTIKLHNGHMHHGYNDKSA